MDVAWRVAEALGCAAARRALAIIIRFSMRSITRTSRPDPSHIKPDNIMLDTAPAGPLLVDFGIARRSTRSRSRADADRPGDRTPHYMSPEQALGDRPRPALDLYSLLASLSDGDGSPPFDGESSQQVVGKHIADPPPAASDVNPKVPRELSTHPCAAPEAASDRFQSAGE